MAPKLAQGILRALSVVYILLYLFLLFVATVTSGGELIRQPGAWYAALAPWYFMSRQQVPAAA